MSYSEIVTKSINALNVIKKTKEMQNYLFKKEFDGRYLLREVPIIEGRTYKAYYVDYPSTNDDDDLNWSFFTMVFDNNGNQTDCEDWDISKEEQEEIKNHIRTVLKPDDLNEYRFIKWYDYAYLIKHPSYAKDENHVVYYPHYEVVQGCNPGVCADWVFEIEKIPEDDNEEKSYYEWIPTEYEKKVIMGNIRMENPEDLVEFIFMSYCEGEYIVTKDSTIFRIESYIVRYPTKELNKWDFYKVIEPDAGYRYEEEWKLEKNKKEYIKEYIRNVLKPADLYESEEKEMDKAFENRLVFDIPKEKHEDVKRIVEAFINNEDEYMVDDMFVDEYLGIVKERDELQEKVNKTSEDQNPLDALEVEDLKDENRMLRAELAAISEKNEGKSILEMPLSEVLEVIDNMKKGIGNKVIVCKENGGQSNG